jgi:16S rRNA (uracil1498-N3)-methyltransferase
VRVHRLRLEALAAGERRVSGPAGHHLARVLRVRPGAAVVAFDGAGLEAAGSVSAVDEDGVWLRLDEPAIATREATRSLTLAVALLKGDKLADVVRMGTELGVAGFRPFVSRRCDVRSLSVAKHARLERVASEAARQCGRARVPEVATALPIADLGWSGRALVADPGADLPWRDLPADDGGPMTVITGPEGGLSDEEIAAFVARGATGVRLGPRVLRAETAPVAAAAAWLLAGEP